MGIKIEAAFVIAAWTEADWKAEAIRDIDGIAAIKRAVIKKTFTGRLSGRSTAEFLSTVKDDRGAGYTVLERFVGRLDGREGGFDMIHGGIDFGDRITAFGYIVSGTGHGALSGIMGTVAFRHEGDHAIVSMDYDLG